jgi:chromosome segregation ATPase
MALGCVALVCAPLVTPTAAAQGKGDAIERLSRRLERDARELREEVITHFRKSRAFKDLERHTREIERQAAVIHKLTDVKARPRQVREALDKIDEEVRHLDVHIREMARDKAIDGRAFDHLRDELTDINRTLSRLRRELR